MGRTVSRYRKVARDVRAACYAGLDSTSLRRRVTTIVVDAFDADASTFVEIDAGTSVPRNSVLHGYTDAFCDQIIREAYLRSPVLEFGRRAARGERAARVTELPIDLRDDPYLATIRDHGYADDAQAMLAAGGRPLGFLALVRRRNPRFDDDEISTLEALRPHLAAAMRGAALRAERDADPGRDTAMLVLDAAGRVEVANAAADVLLRTPAAPGVWEGMHAVATVLRTAVASAALDAAVPALGILVDGRRYTLRAERGIGGDGAPRTIVFLEPPQRTDAGAAFGRLGLSPREVEVAGAMVRGESTMEIAAATGLSPNTVKTHARSIFEKLGIGSRRELVRRFVHR